MSHYVRPNPASTEHHWAHDLLSCDSLRELAAEIAAGKCLNV